MTDAAHVIMSGADTGRCRALVAGCRLADALSGATLHGPVRAIDATPDLASNPLSAAMIRHGGAAVSLDPLSARRVQEAVQSALEGAIVVNALFRRPATADAARIFYVETLGRTAARHAQRVGRHYAAAAIAAWMRRKGVQVPATGTGT